MIIQFDNKKQFLETMKNNITIKIGHGSEGNVYLSKDGDVIKIMLNSWLPKNYGDYPNIIMDDTMKIDSFIFPKELYILNGVIVGYKEKFFPNNILTLDALPELINIDKLVEARKKFIEDSKIITEAGYRLYELPRNIMFDNKKIVAIDTLDYQKKSHVDLEDNIGIIDYAILVELSELYPNIGVKGNFDEEIGKVYSYNRKHRR